MGANTQDLEEACPGGFPASLDNTQLEAYRKCPRKFDYMFRQHYKPRVESTHLVAGKAYAAGLEAMRRAFFIENLDTDTALAHGLRAAILEYGGHEPQDEKKSLLRVCMALEYYTVKWPLEEEEFLPLVYGNSAAIEFTFAEPFPHPEGGYIFHPVTGDPILFTGKFDQIVNYYSGLMGEDDKTTKQLGATWPYKWDLSSQFSGYCWAARQQGIPLDGMIVRGMAFYSESSAQPHAALQAVTHRRPNHLLDWLRTTQSTVLKMLDDWRQGYWMMALGDPCNEYGGCPFRDICRSPNPEAWLESDFARRVWNPIEQEEV